MVIRESRQGILAGDPSFALYRGSFRGSPPHLLNLFAPYCNWLGFEKAKVYRKIPGIQST
jgi:hypothetical protein